MNAQYYVMKTGMDMFDACRAYGLGLLTNSLKKSLRKRETVTIHDSGLYYRINGPKIDPPISETGKNELLELFDMELPWRETFLTIQRSRRKELKKNVRTEYLNKKTKEVLVNGIDEIIQTHKEPTLPQIPDPEGESLLGPMDLVAFKGYRVPVRVKSRYTEGSSLKVPAEDWALAALGETHFAIWRGGKTLVSIIPQPERIMVKHCKDIRDSLYESRVNRVSTSTVLAHIAVLLAMQIRSRKKRRDIFVDKFSSLIYGAMRGTAQQRKPTSGGIFPLDSLYSLINSDLEVAGGIFEIWDHVFKIGSRKGREDLSLCLSEFIAHPTRENLEQYSKIHLRYLLRDDVKIRAWPENCVKEVMKNVGD